MKKIGKIKNMAASFSEVSEQVNGSSRLSRFVWQAVELPLECVILLIGGMTLAVTGCLLFAVASGNLPYYENGFFGLLLVVFSLQTITLGKTPFGEMRRSRRLLGFGLAVGAIGIVTGVIPALLAPLPRMLLFFCFGLGGSAQLLRLYHDETRLRVWLQYGGIFRHLAWACSSVYSLSAIVGLLLLIQPPLPTSLTATILFLFGCSVLCLAGVLRLVYRVYPASPASIAADAGLTFEQSMLLFTGVFMVLLGLLLVPVSLGLLPFAANAQLGLLMIIFALQMLAVGNTPIGPFPRRSWFMVSLGLLFALPGIISCSIPHLLVAPLTVLVGVLNLLGGLLPLGSGLLSTAGTGAGNAVHPLLKNLTRTQLLLNLLSILFGASMLVPGIIPGLLSGVILALNGGVLLYLLRLLICLAVLAQK